MWWQERHHPKCSKARSVGVVVVVVVVVAVVVGRWIEASEIRNGIGNANVADDEDEDEVQYKADQETDPEVVGSRIGDIEESKTAVAVGQIPAA